MLAKPIGRKVSDEKPYYFLPVVSTDQENKGANITMDKRLVYRSYSQEKLPAQQTMSIKRYITLLLNFFDPAG